MLYSQLTWELEIKYATMFTQHCMTFTVYIPSYANMQRINHNLYIFKCIYSFQRVNKTS